VAHRWAAPRDQRPISRIVFHRSVDAVLPTLVVSQKLSSD
jgi:hypothetical protein